MSHPVVQSGEAIERRIHFIRGERVILDADLAELYGVTTGRLNEAVSRNPARFPNDFCFRLSTEDASALISQSAISKSGRGGRRRSTPRAFTEQGVAMLSSVLHSPRAIAVNVLVMRAFVQLRRAQGQYVELRDQLERLAGQVEGHEELLTEIMRMLAALERGGPSRARPIGFRPPTHRSRSARGRRAPN